LCYRCNIPIADRIKIAIVKNKSAKQTNLHSFSNACNILNSNYLVCTGWMKRENDLPDS